jgi:outer membrane protein assembly factor BamB
MDHDIMILQGSRYGFGNRMSDSLIPSFRAISFRTGQEMWRFNVPRTRSYSRDVDGSALLYNGKVVLGAENGILYVLNPTETEIRQGIIQPKIISEYILFDKKDIIKHRGNLTIESSPALANDVVYISCGSGHIYGVNLKEDSVVWNFRTGSDLDGSVTITDDNKLLCGIEKQYIKGKGGMIKLDPSKNPPDCVDWFFPTGDKKLNDWEGGIIGSQAVNEYIKDRKKQMVAFNAIDGHLYVVSLHDTSGRVLGFDGKTIYPRPKLLFKKKIGGSISTPVFVDDYLITQGYGQELYVFHIEYETLKFIQVGSINIGCIESTPIFWENKIFIGSRDGYFYCIGEKD